MEDVELCHDYVDSLLLLGHGLMVIFSPLGSLASLRHRPVANLKVLMVVGCGLLLSDS